MTTIACNRKEMACDSRASSDDGSFYERTDKVTRIGDELVGCAGSHSSIYKFLAWYRRGDGERPELEDFEAVVLSKSGIYHYSNSAYGTRIGGAFLAIGSGGMPAKAAMLCGCSPAEAVKVAIQCDKHSGGRVRTFTLET